MTTPCQASSATANDQPLTVDAVFVALREILNQRLDADSVPHAVIRHVDVTGSSITVHLAARALARVMWR
jgi:hypothetical protein